MNLYCRKCYEYIKNNGSHYDDTWVIRWIYRRNKRTALQRRGIK